MTKRPIFAAFIAVAAFVVAGCAQKNAATDAGNEALAGPVMATVNGLPISQTLFDFYVENRTKNPASDVTPENRERLTAEIVQLYTVASAAQRAGLAKDPEIASQLELQKMNLLAQNFVRNFVEENPVSDDELRAGYEELTAQGGPKEFKARHILLESEDEAKAVIAELQGGAEFAELAKTKSTGPSAKDGGDLGWFTAETMVPEFSTAVAGMDKGAFSQEPVQTQFGWHVILAEDTRVAPPQSFEAYRQEVEPSMQQQKIQAMLESLKAQATVVQTEG